MTGRPWIVRMRDFWAYMHRCGWRGRAFIQFGQVFAIVGMMVPSQMCRPANDNEDPA